MSECRECHNDAERRRRAGKRTEADRKAIAKFTTQLKNETDDRRVRLLCLAMIKYHGGLQQLVRCWVEQLEHCRKKNPGGFAAMGFFSAIARLSEYCEAQKPKPSEMTDEELHEAAMGQTVRLIQSNPQLAVVAAQRLGWKVVPPG